MKLATATCQCLAISLGHLAEARLCQSSDRDKPVSAAAQERDLHSPTLGLSVWCIIAAFGTYFCMYAFRKPFTAGQYGDATLGGIAFKTVLVTSQVLGYMLSKFIGIKVIAEMPPKGRARAILVLIGLAEVALLLFAVVPPPFNFVCLFLNGLPLGMVFGLVLGFLEGRRATEALTAGLCASFILADGVTKSVGAELLTVGVSEYAMPFVAGMLFVVPLVVFVWMLARIPPPSHTDIVHRTERKPMNRAARRAFFRKYGLGLSMIVAVYLLVTILRSVRADFAPEIWKGLGTENQPSVFTRSEIWVMLGVIAINGSCVLIRDNRRAFNAALAISFGGLVLIGVALLGLREGWLGGFAFMVLIGLGLYIPYVAVHTTIFERLIAMTRDRGNIGYLMYLADAIGYLGYVGVMLVRSFFSVQGQLLDFFMVASVVTVLVAGVLLVLCWLTFRTEKVGPDLTVSEHSTMT